MKTIFTYNVNSLRSAIRKGFWDWLYKEAPDVVCLQETKLHSNDLDFTILYPEGYHAYWHTSIKKGYSGVAVFSKEEAKGVFIGIGIDKYDFEARVLRIDFEEFSVISVYVPSGSMSEERQIYKNEFLIDFYNYVDNLRKKIPNLIISGDYNIAHNEIDLYNPSGNKNSTKFLLHERNWITKLLELGFVDAFRIHTTLDNQYTWWSYGRGVREKNKGWRLDYHIISSSLVSKCLTSSIYSEIDFSDHCPVKLIMDL